MAKRDVVVIGASAGGVEALREVVSRLPVGFPAAVLVVLHVPATGGSALPTILGRAGPLPARHAVDGDLLTPGRILIAPPDQHLVVYDHAVTLSRGPKENGHRPAVDVLFRSAAKALGHRLVAVLLSGALDDGTAGMVAVELRGGSTVVQDPEDALHRSMPASAIAAVHVEHVLPAAKIAGVLASLVGEEVTDGDADPAPDLMRLEAAMADLDRAALFDPDRPGRPSGWSCPDCHGALFEITEGGLRRFRCRVGHAWSPESLLAQQTTSTESALWIALRALEEKVALADDLAHRARRRGHTLTADRFQQQADETTEAARLVRDLIAGVGDQQGPLDPEVDVTG